MTTPRDASGEDGASRLLRRVTRAQKVVAGASAFAVVIAVLASAPTLAWPVSAVQSLLRPMVGLNRDGTPSEYSAYAVAVLLLGIVFVLGPFALWLVLSWRLGKFSFPPLFVFTGVGIAIFLVAKRSPMRTLWSWIAVAAMAIAYLNYWRKGRFGYTRGLVGALFAHFALICFLLALPFVLVQILTGDARAQHAQRMGAAAGPTVAQGARSEPDCSILEMTSAGCAEDAHEGSVSGGGLPPHDLRPVTADGRIEVATDATAPTQLRALFDAQRHLYDPGAVPAPRDYRGTVLRLAEELSGGLAEAFGPVHPSMEVRIRCASVPDLPGVDPLLASGWFAMTEQGAEQAGLRSTDEVVFETSGRENCDPPPPPSDAVTPEEVFTALERVGLEVTNPRPSKVATWNSAQGLGTCYAYGCLQQVSTDEVTVTVWPTAEVARARIDRSPAGEVVIGGVAGGWVGAIRAGAIDPFDTAVLFGSMTTVHLSANAYSTYEEAIGCRDVLQACVEAYKDRVRSAAATVDRPAP
jgi:hypothetical protein